MEIIVGIIFWIIGLFILYAVIESAVRNGINHSIVAKFIEEKHGIKEDKSGSFLDHDIDDDE